MNEQDLKIIIEEGEGYNIEFKESLNRIDREMVAFANSSGGRILLGITDSSIVTGFHLTNKLKSEILSIAENCDPPIRVKIEKFDNISIINVPEGKRKPYKCSTGYFLRNGASSQKMKTDDIVAVIQNEGRLRFDEIFDKRFDASIDFDLNKYKIFQRKCGISDEYSFSDVLNNLGIIDRVGGKDIVNNAGVLLFAKQPAKYFVHSVITCVLYKGTEKLSILDRKDFSSDLISNIEDSIIFLKKHLNVSYKIETLQREEILEIPETALREAIVNAVVHRDYFEKGANISIEVFDDRLEISSPGGLPGGLKLTEFGTRSVARNPLLASLLLRANYIERLGTGIRRIRNSMKSAGLLEPEFEIGSFFTVKFQRPVFQKSNTEILSDDFYKINSLNFGVNFGVNFGLKGKRLTRVTRILALIYKGEFSSVSNFGVNFGVSTRTIENDLSFLKKIKFIMFQGPDKNGTYVTTDKFKDYLVNFSNKS